MKPNPYPEVEELLRTRPRSRTMAEAIQRIEDATFRAHLIEMAKGGATFDDIRREIGQRTRERYRARSAPLAERTVAPVEAMKSLVAQAKALKGILSHLSDSERKSCRNHVANLQQIIAEINEALGE